MNPPPIRILVIEDEMQIRKNVAQLLTFKGFDVQTAANGREGISQALLYQPDLVLCDVMMPEVDGYQVLQVLRQNRTMGQVPFIFLTAKADSTDLRKGMALGADDYLTKPFAIADLLTAINSRLERETERKADLQAKLAQHRHAFTKVSTHEYNTPLNGILGFADLLIENYHDFDEEDSVSMLNMIKVCGWQLKRSLDNVKRMELFQDMTPAHASYAAYTTGQTLIAPEEVEKWAQMVQFRQDKTVSCHMEIENAQLELSEENLRIILDELLDNAVKFSEGKQPVLISGQCNEGGYRLTITNEGRLFNSEDISRIAPYVQFERNKYEQQGLGLGLSLVKKVLELNRGDLDITSLVPNKTTVSIRLPLA